MSILELRLLGTLQVVGQDGPVRYFHSDKVRALLAYLAIEADRPHARASLAALFWPEQSNATALRNLSQTLARLRKVLGHTDQLPAPLRITAQSIQWLSDRAVVDATDFVRLARSADPHDLARAAALYQGEVLAGFALPDCEAFEEWLLLTREQFHQQALAALHTLAEHELSAQRWTDAAAAARRQIELDRWREDAHRQLMRALAGLGDRAAALAAYQRYEQILHDDLNIVPDDATVALAAMIRAGTTPAPNPPAPHSVPAVSEAAELRPSLPAALSPLIGREGELARIEALLRTGATRLVTIMGVGGAGKTRLALAAAWALRDAFADGVGWVPLAGIASAADPALQTDALAAAVGAALGMTFDGRRAPLDELRRIVSECDLLLVLDNCEHLPIAAFVHELLAAGARLRVLTTSRAQLNMASEVLLRLEGLPVPEAEASDPARFAGVQLFLERAQRHVHSFGRSPAELAAVARLCRLLDGLPLGIELAARWIGHYTCDEIAAEIAADLDFLADYGRDIPDRHRSLRAAFDYSWTMLREPERQVLARLSVFHSTFDRAAAQAICVTPVTILAALVDASLLRHLGVGRYGVHELIRQFAAARLADRGEADALAERHATYYLDLLAQQEPLLYGAAPQTAAAIIRDTADNLRQAWGWAVAHSAWDSIARSLPALRQYAAIDGLFYEQASRIAEAADLLGAQIAQSQPAPEQLALLGRLRSTQAYFLERQEARDAAAAAARAGIASSAAAGDAVGEAYGYLHLSNATVPYIASLAPRAAALAIDWLERAITLCRATNDLEPRERHFAIEVEASCLLKLSSIRIDRREYVEACALGDQALALTRINGDRLQEARALSFSAMALENAGRYQTAYERRITMLEMARANGSRPQEQVALNNLSCTLIYLGDYPAALEYARATMQFSGEWMQNAYGNADCYHTLSWAACRAGEPELALETAQQALGFAQTTGIPQNQTLPLLALGDALYDLQRYNEAHATYNAALTLGRQQQTPQPVAVALTGIARCRLAQGALAAAQAAVDEVLRGPDVLTLGSLWEPLRVAETCYRVLQANGDPRAAGLLRAAVELLGQQASAIDDEARRRVFREHVPAHQSLLAALADKMRAGTSPEVPTQ